MITFRDFVKLLVPLERSVVPAYIVGLPDDPFEAEVAKSKFLRVVNNLGKAFPKLQEVRSTVKTSRILGDEDRLRYEVSVTIKMPERVYAFSESGWSLPNIYDSLSNKIKRILAQKHLERRRKKHKVRRALKNIKLMNRKFKKLLIRFKRFTVHCPVAGV